ncbi:hypothetical protein AB3S75_037059 [Citrus x aurantiifolia]
MAIKVDLEKAYDRLSWNFIHDTLQELNLPIGLINLIMACITTTRMNILWNGELTSEFSPCRGVDKGILFRRIFLYYVLSALATGFRDQYNKASGNQFG